MVVHRHVRVVFLPNPPTAIFNLYYPILLQSRIGKFPKTLLLVSCEKIQYARDGERPDL